MGLQKTSFNMFFCSAITGNWERKRPVWAMLMVNGLTKGDIASRGFPVLDLYLAQMAAKLKKKVFGFVCFRLTLKYSKRWAQLSVWRSSASPSMASPMARFTSHLSQLHRCTRCFFLSNVCPPAPFLSWTHLCCRWFLPSTKHFSCRETCGRERQLLSSQLRISSSITIIEMWKRIEVTCFFQELQMWKSQLNCFQPRYNTGDKNHIKFDFYSFQWPSIDIDKWIYINRYFPLLPGSTFDGTQPSWHGRGKDRQRDWRLLQVLSCVSLVSGLKLFFFFMQGPADIQEEQEDGRQSDWAALEQSGSDFFPLILRLKIWNASWFQITQASPFSLLLARAILSGSRLSLTLSGKLASK